jgi:branched-chain amino acid transport system permease protein
MELWRKVRGGVRKKLAFFILLGWVLLIIGDRVDELRVYQGAQLAMYAIALASIVLLTGYSGQVSLGNGAMMAVGGYGAALTLNNLGSPIWFAFLMAVVTASLFGALLGAAAARLSGPYLAGTTLALAVGLPAIANQFAFLGGEPGLLFDVGFPPERFGEEFTQYKWFFWIAGLVALVALFITSNILSSRFGRTWRAIRGNSLAAELCGVHSSRMKVLAFTISSGLAGLAGAVLAMIISLVAPGAFNLALSFALLTGAVLAGISSLPGVGLGAVILVFIPEIADALAGGLGDADKLNNYLPGLIVSVLLILSVIFTPNGPGENLRKHRHKKPAH